jgi:hypothetical protein
MEGAGESVEEPLTAGIHVPMRVTPLIIRRSNAQNHVLSWFSVAILAVGTVVHFVNATKMDVHTLLHIFRLRLLNRMISQ